MPKFLPKLCAAAHHPWAVQRRGPCGRGSCTLRGCAALQRRAIVDACYLAAIGLAGLILTSCDAQAQFLEPDQALKAKRPDVVRILREDKAIPPADKAMFDEYFLQYALPQFAAKENVTSLPKVRKDIRIYYTAAQGANGPPHQRANQLMLEKFKEILRIKLPPGSSPAVQSQVTAIKVTVVLALGEMNEQEQAVNIKAKPYPEALTMLLAIFNSRAKDGKTTGLSDALRFAALVGIQTHADSPNLSPEARAGIQQGMLAAIKQKQPPEGRNPETHNALRRRAATTLGMLDDLGLNGAVAKALDAVLADPTEPPRVRSDFAAALGMFKYSPDSPVDFKAMANHVGWLVIDAGKPEITAAAEKDTPTTWRRLRLYARNCTDGLGDRQKQGTIVASPSDPSVQKFVEGVGSKVKAIDKTLDNPKKLDNATIAKAVGDKLKELEGLLEPRAVAPKLPDRRPVAPAPAKPAKQTSAVGDEKATAQKPPAVRRPQFDAVSAEKIAPDVKPSGEDAAQDIEPAPNEVHGAARR